MKAIEKHDVKNALVGHWDLWHSASEEPPLYTFKISKICQSSLERQIWEGVEIETSAAQRLMNQKGEWGCNLPPAQATTYRGEVYQEDKGKKRQAGRPPEPPEPPDGGQQEDIFGEQFRQRKRRRVEARRLRIMSAPAPIIPRTPDYQKGPDLDNSVIPVIPEMASAPVKGTLKGQDRNETKEMDSEEMRIRGT